MFSFSYIAFNIFIYSTGDIIIERWVPYGAQAKRRTIVQRAAAAQQYAAPRNIIIQYEPVQVRIVRRFERLGVTAENPAAYVARYGATLLDAATLVQQARSAGVVEDIVRIYLFSILLNNIHFFLLYYLVASSCWWCCCWLQCSILWSRS